MPIYWLSKESLGKTYKVVKYPKWLQSLMCILGKHEFIGRLEKRPRCKHCGELKRYGK